MLDIEFGSRRAMAGGEPDFTGTGNRYSVSDLGDSLLAIDEHPDWYSMNIIKHLLKMEETELENLMCLSCIEREFVRLLKPIESHIAKLDNVGRICKTCAAEWGARGRGVAYYLAPEAEYHCADCGTPICSSCGRECAGCKKRICNSHETEFCQACLKKQPFRRGHVLGSWPAFFILPVAGFLFTIVLTHVNMEPAEIQKVKETGVSLVLGGIGAAFGALVWFMAWVGGGD